METCKLFAKCHAISQTGKFLVMERLSPIDKAITIDLSLFPHWLNDKKTPAFGTSSAFGLRVDGQVKVLDYGEVNFYEVLNPPNWQRR